MAIVTGIVAAACAQATMLKRRLLERSAEPWEECFVPKPRSGMRAKSRIKSSGSLANGEASNGLPVGHCADVKTTRGGEALLVLVGSRNPSDRVFPSSKPMPDGHS
ncbi:uncharacterized protein B0I36DRAFT_111575 [Microdochium trichocladiopsis]|uniref:Uncharacterized protein n=1 Tax=Microdochium trichocladiopsis TaxID=1682393 RepID=A0A9P9BVV3_9PEZI|nr:uncharacterized protein B0I36DRAFT_111575 [Microdochium trichocladiopsis]KAH7033702.1 hypothetical protein B0I36DRAFT_111575 [Microdochium trichocladiopsis]